MSIALNKRAEGKIVYRFATPYYKKKNTIYVNVIPEYSCVNSCRFCNRKDAINGYPNVYEKKAGNSLYLTKTPSVKKIIEEVKKNMTNDIKEVAFVGLGEPLLQFKLVKNSITEIKKQIINVKVRVDTNGLVKLWHKSPARELKKAGLDEIRISVNATSEEEYKDLCRPKYENAFTKLCEFVKDCLKEGIETKISFVIGFDKNKVGTERSEEYVNFASTLGIKKENVLLREYFPPMRQT